MPKDSRDQDDDYELASEVESENTIDLSGRSCLVTGAGRGLGKATALGFAARGANLLINDLGVSLSGEKPDKQPIQETAREITETGGEVTASFGDVTSFEYAERLVNTAIKEYGRLDFVVNFAGIQRDSLIHEMSEEEWDSVINVHLKGHFSILRASASYWRTLDEEDLGNHRGYMAISSARAMGSSGQINYASAKAGILGLARSAARELNDIGVRANAIMPAAKTRMTAQASEEYEYSDAVDFDNLPPEKVTPLLIFLASEHGVGITGCTFGIGADGLIYVTDPEFKRSTYREGGWTAEAIAEKFSQLTAGEETQKTEVEGLSDFLLG